MRKILSLLIVGAALLLTGCASYQANSLAALDPEYIQEYPDMEEMEIGCKAFNKEECYTYLDRDVIAKGFQPIQLTFHNNSGNRYVFSTKEISLPCASPETVAKTVRTNTVARVTGYSVGGLLVWPLFIPAIVDGIKSSTANKNLEKDFYDKVKTQFVIRPNSYNKTLIFVPRDDMAPVFNMALLNEATGESKTVTLSVVD